MTFSVYNDSHHYPLLSWYVRESIDSCPTEVVDEEAGHQLVWGLPSDGSWRRFESPEPGAAMVEQVNEVVGTMESPTRMVRLVLEIPRGEAGFDVLHRHAERAYAERFRRRELPVYYTRKKYENVRWEFFGQLPKRPINTVLLPRDMQTDLLRDVRAFYDQERTYVTFGKPYKRVLCLYGPPGTGKTSIVTAVASELDRPLAIFNVDSLRDDTFIELLSEIPSGAILLFEDVDSLFRDERKSAGEGGMTFSSMLNALDGVLTPRGSVVFLTTNHIEKLDDALRRPGRIDRLVHVPFADAQQTSALWRRAFPRHDPPKELLRIADRGQGISPAQLSDVMFRVRDEPARAAGDAVVKELR